MRVRRVSSLLVTAAVAAGCSDRPDLTAARSGPAAAVAPTIRAVAVAPDTADALAANVTFSVQNADSARVLYRVDGGPEQAAPPLAVRDSARVPLLALPAGASVSARVVATASGRADTSATATGARAPVPDVVARVRLVTAAGRPSAGFVLTALMVGDSAYAIAFDTTGRVAWYRAFAGAPSTADAYQQPSGDFTLFLGASRGWDPFPDGHFVEFRPTGEVAREWRAPGGYYTDPHELLVGAGGAPAYFFGYDRVATDLTARGGAPDSMVAAHTIFRVDASGQPVAVFAARDHFTVADWVIPPAGIGDIDHPNSIDVDVDGDLIVSWRNVGEVSKIDPRTGQFVWRLGGPHNQFTFVGDPLGGFGGQHYARVLPNGDLLLYDNGWTHTPNETRAAEYRVDPAAHTATLVWQFRHQPAIFTPFVGSVQRLASGDTFVGYGNAGVATEVNAAGTVVWEGVLSVDGATNGSAYRFLKIAALDHYAPP